MPARTSQDTARGAYTGVGWCSQVQLRNSHLTSKIPSNPFPCRSLQWDDHVAWDGVGSVPAWTIWVPLCSSLC